MAGCLLASCGFGSRTDSAGKELRRALEAARWSEARFTGAIRHADCPRRPAGKHLLEGSDCIVPDSLRQSFNKFSAAESFSNEGDDPPDSEGRARAELAILLDESGLGSEEAMEVLGKAAESTKDGGVLNDLAAAYMLRAQRTDQPSALAQALEAADRAVQLQPQLPEALFNRALALQALGLDQVAAEAWDVYTDVETDPGWRREAAANRERLSLVSARVSWRQARQELSSPPGDGQLEPGRLRTLIEGQRTAVRHWLERELLSEWGGAIEGRGQARADQLLETARRVTETLSALQGDLLLLESVNAIDEAARANDGGRRTTLLARGHRSFGEAHAHLLRFRPDDARGAFQTAARALAQGGSPFRWKAELGLAVCEILSYDISTALGRLGEAKAAAPSSAPLLARAAWLEGLGHEWMAQPLRALRGYRESLRHYRAAGEIEGQTNVESRLAELLRHVGDNDEAWRHRYLALKGLKKLRESSRIHFVLGEASNAVSEMNLLRTALLIQQQALNASLEADDDVNPVTARLNLAAAKLRVGLTEQARTDLDLALGRAKALQDPSIRRAIESAIQEVDALLWMSSDPMRAVRSLTASIELREAAGDRPFLPKLYGMRAAALRAAGDAEAAKSDLWSAVRATEMEWREALRMHDEVREPGFWPVYFDQTQGIFGQLIEELASSGRVGDALAIAEQARARELLDLLGGKNLPPDRRRVLRDRGVPRTAQQIRRGLPADALLVEYRVIQGRLLVWVVSRDKIELVRPATSVWQIESWVKRFYRNLTLGFSRRDVKRLLENLHRALIPEEALAGATKLVFVPDGPIHGVPFSALLNPKTGRHLVQDHVVAIAPSATLYLVALERNRQLARGKAESVLLVSDPAFDASLFPDLARLPAAKQETEEVARHYPTSRRLNGEQATREAVLGELGRFSVVHFSGHAIPNFSESYKSILALAPTPTDEGALQAFELMERDFDQTRLVVLSACSTAGGHPIGSLGVSSLVRPFLGGGVPAVVASLWAIRDSSPSRLFSAFHKNFTAGENASTALRNAQLEIIGDGAGAVASLESWAAFEVIGEASPTKETSTWDSH